MNKLIICALIFFSTQAIVSETSHATDSPPPEVFEQTFPLWQIQKNLSCETKFVFNTWTTTLSLRDPESELAIKLRLNNLGTKPYFYKHIWSGDDKAMGDAKCYLINKAINDAIGINKGYLNVKRTRKLIKTTREPSNRVYYKEGKIAGSIPICIDHLFEFNVIELLPGVTVEAYAKFLLKEVQVSGISDC